MEKNLVCFHIGRGGRFNNGGHKSFLEDIKDFQQLLSYYDDHLFLNNEDEDGNVFPDDEWTITDCSGSVLLEGREEIESETGCLDFDGEYDTSYVKEVEDCDEEELDLIIKCYNDDYYLPRNIIDAACDMANCVHVHTVKANESCMKIYANEESRLKTISRDEWKDSSPRDFEDWLRDEMYVLERDIRMVTEAADDNGWFD